jgi:hypothetical protein
MTPEETYRLAAILAAHRLLIRELVVLTFGRLPNPTDALDGFIQRLSAKLDVATVPKLGGAASDAMAQEIGEAVKDVLAEARSDLASLLSGLKP